MVVRSIGVGSAAKVMGALYAGIGLLFGGVVSLFSVLGAAFGASQGEGSAIVGLLFGVGAVVVMPIFYGVMGVIGGAIGALLYNLVAGFVGGIELEVEGGR